MEGYGFCEIIAILSYHNHSLYKEPKEPEDFRVGLHLAMVAVATISRNRLKLFVVIGVLLDILKSNHEPYGNMKDLLRAIEISEAAIEQALPEDMGGTESICALCLL